MGFSSVNGALLVQYHIIRECQHTLMRDCRQKHFALLDIRRNHLRRTNNPNYALFQAYLDFASTLGEDKMSHTAWTGMLALALLDVLVEANKVAGLDGTKAYRRLLRQVKCIATASRNLYRARYLRMREIRGESRTTLHLLRSAHFSCKTQQPHQAQETPYDGCSAHRHKSLHGEPVFAHITHTLHQMV